jgi:hypothetical protein
VREEKRSHSRRPHETGRNEQREGSVTGTNTKRGRDLEALPKVPANCSLYHVACSHALHKPISTPPFHAYTTLAKDLKMGKCWKRKLGNFVGKTRPVLEGNTTTANHRPKSNDGSDEKVTTARFPSHETASKLGKCFELVTDCPGLSRSAKSFERGFLHSNNKHRFSSLSEHAFYRHSLTVFSLSLF